MTKIYLFFLIFIIANTQAEGLFIFCKSDADKIQVEIKEVNSKIQFTYLNLNSKDSIPLFQGIVTKKDFPQIRAADKELNQLYPKIKLEWDASQCQVIENHYYLIECSSEAKVLEPFRSNLKINNFNTSVIKEENIRFFYEKYQIRLNIQGSQYSHSSSVLFQPDACTNSKLNFSSKSNPDHVL